MGKKQAHSSLQTLRAAQRKQGYGQGGQALCLLGKGLRARHLDVPGVPRILHHGEVWMSTASLRPLVLTG